MQRSALQARPAAHTAVTAWHTPRPLVENALTSHAFLTVAERYDRVQAAVSYGPPDDGACADGAGAAALRAAAFVPARFSSSQRREAGMWLRGWDCSLKLQRMCGCLLRRYDLRGVELGQL